MLCGDLGDKELAELGDCCMILGLLGDNRELRNVGETDGKSFKLLGDFRGFFSEQSAELWSVCIGVPLLF